MEQQVNPGALLCCCVLLVGFAALCTFLLQRRARVQPSVVARQEAEVVTVASQETVIEASSPAAIAVVPRERGIIVDVVESKFETDLQRANIYEIRLPKGTAWEPDRAINFLKHILATFNGRVVLRIVAEPGRVMWQMIDCFTFLEDTSLVVQAVQSIYPKAEVEVSDHESPAVAEPFARVTIPFVLTDDFFRPTKSVMDIKESDPLVSFVHSMGELQEGERLIYTLCLAGLVDQYTWEQAVKQTQISDGAKAANFGWNLLNAVLTEGKGSWKPLSGTGATGKGKYAPEVQKLFEHKLYDQLPLNVYLLLQKDAVGEDRESLRRIVNPVLILGAQFASEHNEFTPLDEGIKRWRVDSPEKERSTSAMGVISAWIDGTDHPWEHLRDKASVVMSPEEVAALWHLPHRGFATTGVAWAPTRRPAPAALVSNKEGVWIGYNVVTGRQNPIYLHDEDRETHINVVGKTKVGKSTLMHNLIHQDIKSGKGVGVVDPHGKLVEDILRYSIPDERMDDVVVIDIANEEYPPPLNPMAVPGERGRLAAGRVMAVLDKIYGGFSGTPRIADTLAAALVTLWQEETPTVRDVTRLFDDLEYRYSLLSQLDDFVTEEFWRRFEKLSPSRQDELSYPVVYRMRNFYGNPTLYPVMCHSDALDLADLISRGKIILVSLRANEEKVPPREQRLLGAVIVSQLQMAAMRPAKRESPGGEEVETARKKPPFYLYIDEAQEFVTTALDEIFPEARKFGLYLTVAHQFLGQLKGKTLGAVMGNVGTSIVFQVGPDDARALAAYLSPEFKAEDLINLDLHHAAIKMRLGGRTLPAFSLETRPRPGEEDEEAEEREERIRKRSVEQYTPKSREEVLDWLQKRYARSRFMLPREQRGSSEDENWVVTPEPRE